MNDLVKNAEIAKICDYTSASTGTTDCTIVDMQGYDQVTFICALGTVVNDAVVTFQIGQFTASTSGSMVVSEATSGAITSDGTTIALSDTILAITVVNPSYRYLEAQVVKATQNVTIDSVIAIKTKVAKAPVTQGATVYSALVFASPAAA